MTKEKSFITLTPGFKVKNIFFVSNKAAANKLECLHPSKPSQPGVIYVGKDRGLCYKTLQLCNVQKMEVFMSAFVSHFHEHGQSYKLSS